MADFPSHHIPTKPSLKLTPPSDPVTKFILNSTKLTDQWLQCSLAVDSLWVVATKMFWVTRYLDYNSQYELRRRVWRSPSLCGKSALTTQEWGRALGDGNGKHEGSDARFGLVGESVLCVVDGLGWKVGATLCECCFCSYSKPSYLM